MTALRDAGRWMLRRLGVVVDAPVVVEVPEWALDAARQSGSALVINFTVVQHVDVDANLFVQDSPGVVQ